MAIVFTSVEDLGGNSWSYNWAATTGPYSVYYNGVLREETDEIFYVIEDIDSENEPPVIEVLDVNDSSIPDLVANPQYAILQWREVSGVVFYRVEELVGADWEVRELFTEEGSGYYQFNTGQLDDVTVANWRVTAIDELDNESAVQPFDFFIVRNPNPPVITISYNPTGTKLDIRSA